MMMMIVATHVSLPNPFAMPLHQRELNQTSVHSTNSTELVDFPILLDVDPTA
jgi:hypothetical protein